MTDSTLIETFAEALAHMDALGEGVVARDYADRVGLSMRYTVSKEAKEDIWTVNVCDASGKVLASRRLP